MLTLAKFKQFFNKKILNKYIQSIDTRGGFFMYPNNQRVDAIDSDLKSSKSIDNVRKIKEMQEAMANNTQAVKAANPFSQINSIFAGSAENNMGYGG